MMFKKIYVEISNICNLNCSFCSKDNRSKKNISIEDFETILKKINNYTDYIYLHVKGEPLLYPNLKEILDLSSKYKKKVNITTNGTLLKEKIDILNHPSIERINISLHSENNKDNYVEEILDTINDLDKIIVLRYWVNTNSNILKKIEDYYNVSINSNHQRLKNNIFIDRQEEFTWPSLDNDYYNDKGTCYALKDQLAILVDGTIVPCCLDSNGIINLGNIYNNNLEDIINSKRYQDMKKGFQNRKCSEELCKKCSFKDRLKINEK